MSDTDEFPLREMGVELGFYVEALTQISEHGMILGYDPLSSAIAMFQTSLAPIWSLDRAATVRLVRAYADVIENPPGTALHHVGKSAFAEAGATLARIWKAHREFPQPQGSA